MKAIPTIYNGIELKSRFEANVAYLFSQLSLKWQYEPTSFLLPECGLHYMPDFYLPQVSLWTEVRGYELEGVDLRIVEFASMIYTGKMGDQDYLLIKSTDYGEETPFYENEERYGVRQSIEVAAAKCSSCGKNYLFGTAGSYACRHCGRADGNAHIKELRYLDVSKGQVCLGE